MAVPPMEPYRSPESPGDRFNMEGGRRYRWTRELNRYHWFVLVVAALGWLFDTMDQQLFALARAPAMNELLAPEPGVPADPADVRYYGGVATAVFLMGWATGGLFFGIMGDRYGRAKTMMWTILVYSLCTGLSALSVGFWDFALYRFLTGLGVGGEFAVGVALVAEVMPSRARPFALGLLQALSAVGNISAAFIMVAFAHLEESGVLGEIDVLGIQITAWRAMFVVGTLPALLALVIRARLKEPEQWQAAAHDDAVKKKLGSYAELFGDPRWRKRAIVGLLLATSGVIGVWGIAFFSFDLNRSVFHKVFEQEARDAGQAEQDRQFVRALVADPAALSDVGNNIKPTDLLDEDAATKDAQVIFAAIKKRSADKQPVSAAAVLEHLDQEGQSPAERARREAFLAGGEEPAGESGGSSAAQTVEEHAQRIAARTKEINFRLSIWVGYTSVLQNLGAFFGIYAFSMLTARVGRRPAFAVSFIAAGLSTAMVFLYLDDVTDVFWMIPLMGFCVLSLFGGYAIYFPELFPTRLRSTGTSFCYNVGRFIAALGPYTLGLLARDVFGHHAEPLRYAGVTMCAVFLIGLFALPFAPETKGQPLPE